MVDITNLVRYCRDSTSPYYKKYGAVEGCGYVIPPASTRRAAEMLLLGEVDEPTFRAVEIFYEMGEAYAKRALAGAKIFLKGEVQPFGDGYLVRSQSQDDLKHFVFCDGVQWVCNCEDYRYGKLGAGKSAPAISLGGITGWLCKHIAAVGHYRRNQGE